MLFHRARVKQRKCSPSHKRQQGVVIVVALFIVALVAAMAYVMMARLARDTQRTAMILRNTQASMYAQGSIAWAMQVLRDDWEQRKPNQITDPMPIVSPMNEENGYKIMSIIEDAQGRFNVNNVTTNDGQADFRQLVHVLLPQMKAEDIDALTRAVIDWVSPIHATTEFDKYYMQLARPYRSAHRFMLSTSELRLIKGMTPAIYSALEPYLIALPTTTLLNVQTAAAPVLAALSPVMNISAANAIVQLREQAPFVTAQRFMDLDVVKNFQIKAEKITVGSSYFLIQTRVSIENQQLVLYTLVERLANDGKAELTILWQSKGIF